MTREDQGRALGRGNFLELETRFLINIEFTPTCWNWLKGLNRDGYGVMTTKFTTMAHRVSYRLYHGPLIKGLHVDHLCGNTRCVNPAHLEQVTNLVNQQRSWGR